MAAAGGDPMAALVAQVAALTAANAALQPTAAVYARTPALMGQSDLLDFRKKADMNVYTEGKSPVLEGDE
jgi:hypothetical protein